jgi:hypothetical protein
MLKFVTIIRGFQQIACVDSDTGELSEHRLVHRKEAEAFYRILRQRNLPARVGMESSGHSHWFERPEETILKGRLSPLYKRLLFANELFTDI